MDILTQKRFMFWLILLLVVLNLSMTALVWQSSMDKKIKPPIEDSRSSRRTLTFLQRELGFTDAQIEDYDRLRQKHQNEIRPLIESMRQAKREMMQEIFQAQPDTLHAMHIAREIGEKQTRIEKLTFNHFLQLKELSGPDQVKNLHVLVEEFFRKNPASQSAPSSPRRNRPPHPPHENKMP